MNGQVSLLNKQSGLCLDVENASLDNGARLQQYTCNSTAAQGFNFALDGGTLWFLTLNDNSDKCLDVGGNSELNGAPVQQWTCNFADESQLWLRAP